MKMLRLVASDPIIQIDKIILVTHDPELLQLCDSVVDLAEEMSRTQSERAA
jgi:ABC-type lipoprotein export system ATPase subunit